MSKKDKNRINVVYSTNPNFGYSYDDEQKQNTLPNNKQHLKIMLDKKQRAGKAVTLIQGFVGTSEDLNTLAKQLKSKCGVGGTAKDGEILIQGDFREKIIDLLTKEGYNVKRVGGQ
ncbi:MAG: translation initiation factor [Bacteroidia bacterium]